MGSVRRTGLSAFDVTKRLVWLGTAHRRRIGTSLFIRVCPCFWGRSMSSPLIGKFGTFEYSLAERYRFESELGRGGMGAVYRARDVRHARMVAIKMLHTSLTNGQGVLRFQKEIEIAAQLEHPNIVRLLDSGVADGRLYYVMSY